MDFSALNNAVDRFSAYPKTSSAQLLQHARDADILISNKCVVDRLAMQNLPQLKFICVAATGTNNIDLEAARERGVSVSNVSGYGTASVSQHVFTLILALATHLRDYSEAAIDGRWSRSDIFCLLDYPIMELSGKTLGIIGHGELGQAVAHLAQAFGMRVMIAEHKGADSIRPGRESFAAVLQQADVISLHCPLTEQTRNLIGFNEFKMMRPHALLINCARGGIVREADLRKALELRMIGGAGVDVLSEEPPRNGNVLLSRSRIPNLLITPHSAWASREARQRIIDMTADNIRAWATNSPINLVS